LGWHRKRHRLEAARLPARHAAGIALGQRQPDDVFGRVVAKQLALVLFVPGHAVPLQQADEVLRRVARQGRAAGIGVVTEIAGAGVSIGEIAAPAAGDADFFRHLLAVVDHQHLQAQLPGYTGTKQPGGTRTEDHHVKPFHRGSVVRRFCRMRKSAAPTPPERRMLLTNPHAMRCAYPVPLQQLLNIDQAAESRRWLSGWRALFGSPSPLWALPGLARQLGVAHIGLKDESSRSPLASFKVLGAPVALLRLILRQWPDAGFSPADLLAGRHAAQLKDWVVISATDGNHGRALAAAARGGLPLCVVLHAQVSPEREAPIAALGAEIVRITGNYDASVQRPPAWRRCTAGMSCSDTSYPGYEDVPRDVMQGYAVIADELWQADPAPRPDYTHVILQGGVGGFAAGVLS